MQYKKMYTQKFSWILSKFDESRSWGIPLQFQLFYSNNVLFIIKSTVRHSKFPFNSSFISLQRFCYRRIQFMRYYYDAFIPLYELFIQIDKPRCVQGSLRLDDAYDRIVYSSIHNQFRSYVSRTHLPADVVCKKIVSSFIFCCKKKLFLKICSRFVKYVHKVWNNLLN